MIFFMLLRSTKSGKPINDATIISPYGIPLLKVCDYYSSLYTCKSNADIYIWVPTPNFCSVNTLFLFIQPFDISQTFLTKCK